MELLQKLKTRWDIESNWQVLVILIVFSVTGFSAVFARQFIFDLLGIVEKDPFWFKTLIWVLTIFPIYNILLLLYGALFGQFNFFWGFFKKMMTRLVPGRSN